MQNYAKSTLDEFSHPAIIFYYTGRKGFVKRKKRIFSKFFWGILWGEIGVFGAKEGGRSFNICKFSEVLILWRNCKRRLVLEELEKQQELLL